MRHATARSESDDARFVRETVEDLVEKEIELRSTVEDLGRKLEEIRHQISMLRL